MSGNLLEGMARAAWEDVPALGPFEGRKQSERDIAVIDMRCALLWLAENITDEMVDAADHELCSDDSFVTKEVIAAALRKAAGR